MLITPSLLKKWNTCWNDERIAQHLDERRGFTLRQVAEDESISLADRLWVLCRTLCHLDEMAARLFAIESAKVVTHLAGDEDDQAQYLGLLNDLYQIELELPTDQRAAAWAGVAAAWDAVWAASWMASWTETWDVVWDAVWAAARAASWMASWTETWNAAQDAELRKAIARALEWLGKDAGEPSTTRSRDGRSRCRSNPPIYLTRMNE